MNEFTFSLQTFAMAVAGLVIHFLASWHEFYKAADTSRIGPVSYLKLDLPAWLCSLVAMVAFYFAGPEVAAWFGYQTEAYTPGVALLVGYAASSIGPKILGSLVSRASIR